MAVKCVCIEEYGKDFVSDEIKKELANIISITGTNQDC